MRVTPLSGVPPAGLTPLLEQEQQYWMTQLGWDFSAAADLIRSYLAAGSLTGLALRIGERVIGYDYYVIDQGVGYIGNLFIVRDYASKAAYRLLAHDTVRAMRARSRLNRIECQLFSFNCELPALFQDLCFEVRPRQFLSRSLNEGDLQADPEAVDGFRWEAWDSSLFMAVAAAIYDSYVDSPDRGLCRDYQSMRGCVRFLRNLIDSPGCGVFDARASGVVLDPSDQVAGVLVASRIGPGRVMVPQVSVRRQFQGRGLGTWLLNQCFRETAGAGLQTISLSVSESNRGARRLYRRLGFKEVKRFYAYVWNRS